MADKLIEDFAKENSIGVKTDGMTNEAMEAFIAERKVPCPDCGAHNFTAIRKFNLMFKTFQGVTEDSSAQIYLRPETAQGIFVNFKNVQRTTRRKILRHQQWANPSETRSPRQLHLPHPNSSRWSWSSSCPGTDLEWYEYWKDYCHKVPLALGMNDEHIRLREHSRRRHYSRGTTDIEFTFPFGWGELWASPTGRITIFPSTPSSPAKALNTPIQQPARSTSLRGAFFGRATASRWPFVRSV